MSSLTYKTAVLPGQQVNSCRREQLRPERAVRLFRLRGSDTEPRSGHIAHFRRVTVQTFVSFTVLAYSVITTVHVWATSLRLILPRLYQHFRNNTCRPATFPTDGWMEQCFTSPPTQYRLYGRRFLQVKRPNQQYQSTEGNATKGKSNNVNNKIHINIHRQ